MEDTTAPAGEEDAREMCTICQEELENARPGSDREPVASKCDPKLGHVFHRVCLEEWLAGKQAINKTCPICRKDPLADVRVERARKATMARIARKKQYESGVTGKVRLAYGATQTAVTTYWREQIAPNARPVAIGVFVAVLFLCLIVLGVSRLKQRLLDTARADGIPLAPGVDDDLVVTTLKKIKQGEL